MISWNHSILLVGHLVLLLAAGPIACGSGEEAATPVGSAIPRDADARSIPEPDPERDEALVAAELSEKIALPDYYPADAPIYPDTQPSEAMLVGKRASVMFGTPDAIQDVADFMAVEVAERGWNLSLNMAMPEKGIILQATKDGRLLSILVSRVSEDTAEATTLIAVAVDR